MMTYISPINDQRKRHLDGRVIDDGEAIHSNIIEMRDSASDAGRTSIDATVKTAIEQQAKSKDMKPAAWLAIASAKDLEYVVAQAAKAHVSALSGEGIARGFAFDALLRTQVDHEHAAHDAKYASFGNSAPVFDRERATFLARNRMRLNINDATSAHSATSAADRSRIMAGARWQSHGSICADACDGSTRALSSPSSAPSPAPKPAAPSGGAAVADALRLARY